MMTGMIAYICILRAAFLCCFFYAMGAEGIMETVFSNLVCSCLIITELSMPQLLKTLTYMPP